MADTMTPEQRSRCMAAIKGKDTKPELIVRKYLFSRGLRYRLQVGSLPGRPDIVLPKYRAAVFVDGCFWHGHEGCRYFRLPKSNVEFWKTKIERNVARDLRNRAELEALGWRVIRVWECDIRPAASRESALSRLYDEIVNPATPSVTAAVTTTPGTLTPHGLTTPHGTPTPYEPPADAPSIAAEPEENGY